MNVSGFRWFSRGLKLVFEVICVLFAIQGILFLVSLFLGPNLPNTLLSVRDYSFSNYIGSDTPSYTNNFVGFITSSIERFLLTYVFYLCSQFFSYLEKDTTPFSLKVYQKLRRIGWLLIMTDIGVPFIYSLILPFTTMKSTSFYLLAVSSLTAIGIVILFMAEVICYGVTLQNFSDDVV